MTPVNCGLTFCFFLLCLGTALAQPASAPAGAAQPRIVNGAPTAVYPSVGALLTLDGFEETRLSGVCSGTLVGCHTFLVAAHCVCPPEVDSATDCRAAGLTDPAALRVFLPNAGIFAVDSIAINPEYVFAARGDVAVLRLPLVSGVAPSALNQTRRPLEGTLVDVVGYGSSATASFFASDYGVKRTGRLRSGACADDVFAGAHVCWEYDGSSASTCVGDSGGPVFGDLGDGPVIVGIISGSSSDTCSPPDQVFATDVYVNRSWIIEQLNADPPSGCGDLPVVGGRETRVVDSAGVLSEATPEVRLQFDVPVGTRALRVALNGQEIGSAGFFENDFDLFLRAGSPPTESDYDCADLSVGTFGFCDIVNPVAGTWFAVASAAAGDGVAQLTATIVARYGAGDINCDGRVDAADFPALAQVLVGSREDECQGADVDRDGGTDVEDLASLASLIFHSRGPWGAP